MLEMYKRDRFHDELVTERCDELISLEQRLQDVDGMLTQAAVARRAPAGSTRCVCGAPVVAGAHFCANCGRPAGATRRHLRALRLRRCRRRPASAPVRPPRRARAGPRPRAEPCPTVRAAAPPPRPGRSTASSAAPALPAGRQRARHASAAPGAARLRWYPGDWLPIVLALLVIAALATAAAVYAAQDEEQAAGVRTVVATSPPDVTATATGPTETAAGRQRAHAGDADHDAPADGPGPGNPVEWPADEDGCTVVLASMPVSGGRDVALRNARSAHPLRPEGGGRARLARTSRASTPATTSSSPASIRVSEEAQDAVPDARDAGFANAYAREITS